MIASAEVDERCRVDLDCQGLRFESSNRTLRCPKFRSRDPFVALRRNQDAAELVMPKVGNGRDKLFPPIRSRMPSAYRPPGPPPGKNHSTATLASRTKRSAGISRSANFLQILAAGLSTARVARPPQTCQQQGRCPTTRRACFRGRSTDNVNAGRQ